MSDSGLRRAVILTAISLEYQAVCTHLTNFRQETYGNTVYGRGNFVADDHSWDILVVETGMGITKAATETVHAVGYFQPETALFVGIAGGLKDVKIGDVVVATKAYGYEFGRSDPVFRSRPDVYHASRSIEQRARAEARAQNWLRRLERSFPDAHRLPQPEVHFSAIASGNQLVASMDAAVLSLLRSHYNDAVAVEMEGYGFLEALHAYPQVSALIIRGISDLIDNKTGTEDFQRVAAHYAAAFAFEVLAKLEFLLARSGPRRESAEEAAGEKPRETRQSETQPQAEGERMPPEALTEELLSEFRTACPQYIGKIQAILAYVDAQRNISPSWCKSAIKQLDTIGKDVQRLSNDAPGLQVFHRTMLAEIFNRINDLKLELQGFRRPHWFMMAPQRQLDDHGYERIRATGRALLADLEQFSQRP